MKPLKIWTLVLLLVVIGSLTALIDAWALSTIWRWYLAPTEGPGLSYAGWYGVSVISGVLIAGPLAALPRKPMEKPFVDYIGISVGVALGTVLAVCFAWITGQLVGWL